MRTKSQVSPQRRSASLRCGLDYLQPSCEDKSCGLQRLHLAYANKLAGASGISVKRHRNGTWPVVASWHSLNAGNRAKDHASIGWRPGLSRRRLLPAFIAAACQLERCNVNCVASEPFWFPSLNVPSLAVALNGGTAIAVPTRVQLQPV